MAPSPIPQPLRELADGWREASGPSRQRLALAAVAAVTVGALLLARQGTAQARIAAGAAIVAVVVAAVAWRWAERRRLRRPDRIVDSLARPVDPELAARALRALSLLGPDGDVREGNTSGQLARLHVERALARLPVDRILERASRAAGRLGALALLGLVCAGGVALANAWSVLEGADVLVARRGVAPFGMRWLSEVEVAARPPEYVHQPERREPGLSPLMLPYGTSLTVRGMPAHPGRRLLLSDGVTEVPFVDDGAGAEVARWTLTDSVELRVVARFGRVVIVGSEGLPVRSIPDLPPVVALEGAPRQVTLVEETQDLAVRYQASDDHGLREVHLVLRSGTREERRSLARLDGEATSDKGGIVLKLRDAFLKKSHAPVLVTVEAKDNDPLTGPKWGKSEAITVVPPDVGEPEARRLDALRRLRDTLVDSLAWRLSTPPPADAAERRAFVADAAARADADDRALDRTLADSFGGIRVADRLRAMLRAQQQKVRAAAAAEGRAPSQTSHTAVVAASERYVLVLDAIIRGLGVKDSRDAAKLLADVADDLAYGAVQIRDAAGTDARGRGAARMDAAALVLGGGGRALSRLGSLGRDLGEIVEADLLRVARARQGDDPTHAELAARDLATRLRTPDPSFGARGSVGRAGGESGGGRGTPGEDGEGTGDEVDRAQAEAEQDLERLAQEHAGEIGKMEKALAEAASDKDLDALREEARRHAQAVREAARDLPTMGQGSDSWTSKGAAGRELAEQMARSLEQLHPDEATQSGRSALGALDEAARMLQKDAWLEDPAGREGRRVESARKRLDAEEKWAEEALAQLRRHAAERARKELGEGGEAEEKLAERAKELGARARDKGSMPEQAVEAIGEAEKAARQAAQALKQGDADRGLERQRAAQRELEAARQQLRGDEQESASPPPQESDGTKHAGGQVDIPGAAEHKGPEEFRRRVVQGLGQPSSGALRDAVRRYAEGLLR